MNKLERKKTDKNECIWKRTPNASMTHYSIFLTGFQFNQLLTWKWISAGKQLRLVYIDLKISKIVYTYWFVITFKKHWSVSSLGICVNVGAYLLFVQIILKHSGKRNINFDKKWTHVYSD